MSAGDKLYIMISRHFGAQMKTSVVSFPLKAAKKEQDASETEDQVPVLDGVETSWK